MYCFFFFNDTATTEIYTLSLHDALPISLAVSDFHIAELMEGKVALFNMWDRAFTEDEVNSIDCLSEGNLLSMSDMSILGPADLTEEHVPCETGKEF